MALSKSELKKISDNAKKNLRQTNKEEDGKTSSSYSGRISNTTLQKASDTAKLTLTVNFDTFEADIKSLFTTIDSTYEGWQDSTTMTNTKTSLTNMFNRVTAYQNWRSKYGNEDTTDLTELQNYYKDVLDDWDALSERYGKYQNAEAYTSETETLTKLYTMPSKELEGKTGVAYTTSDGYTIKYEDLYNEALIRETTQNTKNNFDINAYGAYKKKDVKYESASILAPEYKVVSDEDAHLYNLVNGDKDAIDYENLNNVHMSNTNDDTRYFYVTDEERKVFNTIWETQGVDKAKEYLNLISPELRQRRTEFNRQQDAAMAKKDPIGASIASIIGNFANNAVALPYMAMDYFDENGIDPNDALWTNRNYVQTTRSTVEGMIDSDIGQFVYRHGMNVADNLAARAVSMGYSGPSQFLMSSGALVDTALDAKQRGLSDEQALGLGIVSGTAEWIFETKGFEAMFDKKTLTRSGWKYFVNNLKTEMIGELATEFTNDVADHFIAQDLSNLNIEFQSYIASGISDKDAINKVVGGVLSRYADVAAGSIFSTGVMAGPGATIGSYNQYKYNTAMGQTLKANDRVGDVFDLANNPDIASAYEIYTDYANKGINAENVSDYKLGRLANEAVSESKELLDAGSKKGKASTVHQRNAAQNILDDVEAYTQINSKSRTGSAQTIDKAVFKDYDAEAVVNLIESGLESAEGTEAYRLATEMKAKVENYDKLAEVVEKKWNLKEDETLTEEEMQILAKKGVLSAKEIAILSDATDQAIKAEETENVKTQLKEMGADEDLANIVARKMRGETLTAEESETLESSGIDLSAITEADTSVVAKAKTLSAEESAKITKDVEKSDISPAVAEVVVKKAEGKRLTMEEADKITSNEKALNVLADTYGEDVVDFIKSVKNKSERSLLLSLYDGKMEIDAFSNAVELISSYARNNFTQDYILKNRHGLSVEQALAIYRNTRVKIDNKKEQKLDKLIRKTADKMEYKGVIDDSIIDYKNTSAKGKVNWNDLDARQKKAVTFVKGLAKASGMNLVLVANNKKFNGAYSVDGNTIYLDVYAGINHLDKLSDTIIPTMSHELTHWMKNKAPALWRQMNDIVFSTLQKADGVSESDRIANEVAKLEKKRGKKVSEEEAREEIVARACEDMLSRSKVGQELFNSLNETEQKTLVEKIKDIIKDLLDWVKGFLSSYESGSYEAKIMRQYENKLNELSKVWDKALARSVEVNQALEKSGKFGDKNTADVDVLHSIREEYSNEIEEWKKDGMPQGETFILGTTGDVLQGLGAIESDIYMLGDKIIDILNDHHEMTIEEIKKIPQILENPILILKSRNAGREASNNTRLVIFGNVKAQDGKPILSVLDLRPVEKNLVVDDMQKVSSAYTKDSNPVDFVEKSLVVYADKKRTTKLLKSIGFEMPIELQRSGYIGSISYFKRSVNIKGEEFSKVFKETNELHSDRDTSGRELSEGQQEYFKDSTVRDENGNLKVMYRGDSSEFTVFDRKKTKHSNLYGRGFYFTDSKAHAEQYGKSREFYLDIKNPLSPKQNAITKEQMLNFLKAIENDGEDYDLYNYGQEATAESVLNSVWGKGDFEMLQDINAGAIGDLVAAVELFNEVNGTSYDGIVLPTETVTFNSEQAKLTSNLNPTKDKDMRFSMRENVEETRDLVAVHNISAEKLLKSFELGGLPMPSIAVVRAREGFNQFAEISMVFDKSTIDPELLKSNVVFGSDAWTPTFPKVDYMVNEKVLDNIRNKINSLVPKNIQNDLGGLHLDKTNAENFLNTHGGMTATYRNSYPAMKYAFLLDTGVEIDLPMKQKPLSRYGKRTDAEIIKVAEKYSEEELLKIFQGGVDGVKQAEPTIRNAVVEAMNEEYAHKPEWLEEMLPKEEFSFNDVLDYVEDALKYKRNGIQQEIDYTKARKLIDEKTDTSKYESWLNELFSDIVAKKGLRNKKDLFTPSGNRRSWETLHYELTLENVVKRMIEEGTQGIGGWGNGNIIGASAIKFNSIDELKNNANNRLQTIPQSEYEKIRKGLQDRFWEIAHSLDANSFSSAADLLVEAVVKYKTKSGIANYLRKESQGWAKYSDHIVDDLMELVNDIRSMPVDYFEAKPQRAIGFNEVKAVIMPAQESYEDDLSEVKAELEKLNIPILEYEFGDNNDRLKALNSLEDVRFSEREDLLTDEDYKVNCKELVKMDSVAELSGTELSGNLPLKQKVSDLFESWGNSINTTRFGAVALTNSSIHSEIRHGTTRNKVISYSAIPSVLEKGVVIDIKKKNHGEVERVVVAAPISIANKPFYMGVMIQRDSNTNQLYLHDVVIKKEASEYQTKHLNTTGSVDTENLLMTEVLEKAISVGYSLSQQSEKVKFSERDYTYENLVSKPDMILTVLDGTVPDNRADIIHQAKKNATKVGKVNPKDKSISVFVDDIGKDIIIGTDGLRHGLSRGKNIQNRPISIVTLRAGEIIKNSIRINELNPSKESAIGSYILIGASTDNDSNLYIVRSVVNEYSSELASMDVLYAINTKKESAMLNASRYANDSLSVTDSTISIAELLDSVNKYFPDILPESVLRHYGYDSRPDSRTDDELGKSVLYSERDDTSVYDIMGEKERILKENEKFKAEIERLKERLKIERMVTHGNYFNENQLGAVAGHLRNISNSNIDKVELMKALKEVYSHIAHSENLAWEDVFERCYRIAESMIAEAKPLTITDDYSKALLKEIRGTRISLDEEQKQDARNRFGKNWNNHFMGKVVIANDGINIDSKWREWSREHPDVFDADTNSNDMISELYDIIDSLKESSEVIDTYSMEEQTRWLANEIYNQYWNVSPIRTTADKYDKRIKQLNFEHRRAMSEYRDSYEKRIAEQGLADAMYYGKKLAEQKEKHGKELAEQKQRQREMHKKLYNELRERKDNEIALAKLHGKEMHKKLYNELRERKDNEIALAKQHGKEMMDKYKENANKKTLITRISANSLSLNEMLVKNSKDKHIPEVLKGPVIKLLNAIDFSSKRMLKKGIPTTKDISFKDAFSAVKDMLNDASNNVEGLEDLYGHDLAEQIKLLSKAAENLVGDNNYVINAMSVKELQALDKLVRYIKSTVNKFNQFHTVNHAKGVANLSQESIAYLDGIVQAKLHDGLRGWAESSLMWSNALPYYVFKRYGPGGMKVFEAMMDGWDKFAFNTKQILDYTEGAYTSKEVKKWSKESKTFEILVPATEEQKAMEGYKPEKQKIELTIPQIMSIYCLAKREQGKKHLYQGGIRVADFTNDKGVTVSQPDGAIFTETEIGEIISSLTDRQREVADKLQTFMNTVCAEWGNAVSMARFGYKAFGEPNYFPIQSDSNNLSAKDATENQNSLYRLLNMSFAKDTDENANNRIVISDIFDVFAQHTSDMAKYNALALPVLDALKWYNYTEKQDIAEGTFKTKGVKQSIERAFGKDGQKYFNTFLKDINGQQESDRDVISKEMLRRYKIATVGANLRVVMLQPTSYLRAEHVIDARYLAKASAYMKVEPIGMVKKFKKAIANAEKYCGMALWKSLGYYDTNIQRGLETQIKHADTFKDKVIDFSMKGAELADKLTWGALWTACEFEIRDTRKDLKVGSEEFYQAIGKRLREVIYATQVVDSTMTRSQIMRSSKMHDQVMTSFGSEPTLSYNILLDSYMDYSMEKRKTGRWNSLKKSRRKLFRMARVYIISSAVTSLIETLWDAFRAGDDDEEDFLSMYLGNFFSNLSITAKIPYVKEIHSLFKGFDFSRSEFAWAEAYFKAFEMAKKLIDGKGNDETVESFTKNLLKGVSYSTGLPIYSGIRDIWELFD